MEHLGSGGQKDVYEVRQESTSQTLAMKELRESNLSDESQKKAMTSEALLQAQLSHPNIPIILSLSKGGDKPPVFVERLIRGKNWLDVMWPVESKDITPVKPLSLEENLDILLSVSRTLAYVHETHRIIHGDLKPENVMLGERGGRYNEIYLVDWGLAVSFESDEPTAVGGTIDYMPPEVYCAMINPGMPTSRFLSPATDVFMLGGILYTILTGKTPYEDVRYETGVSIHHRVEAGKYTPISPVVSVDPRTGKKIPEELVDIVNRALSKEPKDRYTNAEEFAEALTRYQKRSGLSERLDVAQAVIKQLQDDSKPSIMALIENTNELRLIREAAMDSDGESFSSLSRNALQAEETARNLLLETSLASKDFGLTEAQLPIARQHIAILERIKNEGTFDEQPQKLDSFEKRLLSGLASRRRERILKWGLGTATCVIIGLVCIVFYFEAKKAALEAKNVALELEGQIKEALHIKAQEEASLRNQATQFEGYIVPDEHYGQAELTFRGLSNKCFPNHYKTLGLLEENVTQSLLPEQVSSFREITDATAFSSDGKYFVTFSPSGILTCWDTETQVSTARVILEISDECPIYTETNPLFGKEKIAKHLTSSPFILHSPYGAVKFLSDELSVNEQFNVLDVNQLPSDALDLSVRSMVYTNEHGELVMMAAGNEDKVYIFALSDGKLLHSFQTQISGIMNLAISDDGKNLVTVGKDGSIQYWDATTGKLLQTFDFGFSSEPDPIYGFVRRCALSPFGKRIAAGSEHGEIVVWDIPGNKPIAKMNESDIPGTLKNFMNRFYWLDEDRVLSLCLNNHYCLWNLAQIDKELVPASLLMKSDQSNTLSGAGAAAFSRINKQLLVAGNDHTLRLFDIESGKQLSKTEGLIVSRASDLTVSDAQYFEAADRLIVGNFGLHSLYSIDPKTLRPDKIFEPYPGIKWQEVQSCKNLPCSIACPKEGSEFAVAFCSGDIMTFDQTDSKPTHCFKSVFKPMKPGTGDCSIVDVSPSGKYIATTSIQTNEMILFDLKTHKELRRFDKTPTKTSSSKTPTQMDLFGKKTLGLIFTNDETLLELTSNGTFNLWNITDGEWIESAKFGNATDDMMTNSVRLTSYQLSHDTKHIALGFSDGYVKLIDLKTLTTVYSSSVLSLPVSNYNGIPQVFDFMNSANAVTGFTWSKDNSILAASFANGKTTLVERRYNTAFASITSNNSDTTLGNIPSVQPFFTQDDQVITLDSNGIVSRWDYRPSEENATVLKTGYGAGTLCSLNKSDQWAGVCNTEIQQFAFFVYDGDKEKYTIEQVEDFRRFEPSADSMYFIILAKDGKLSVVDQKDGKPVDDPIITNAGGAPKKGFLRIEISPDQRYLAAIPKDETNPSELYGLKYPGNSLYLLDLKEASPVWKQIMQNDKNSFVQISVSTDSKIIVAVDSTGRLRVWNLDTKTERLHVDRLPLQGPMVACNQGRIRFLSDRFLAQCGASNTVVIWDIKEMQFFQNIKLNIFERLGKELNSVNGIAPIPNRTGEEKKPAFVVAGNDGVLRFYQYINEEDKFVSVYTISSLKLASLIGKPTLEKESYLGYNSQKNYVSPDVSDEKMKQDVAEIAEILGEEEFNALMKEIEEPADLVGSADTDTGPFVRSPKNWICDITWSNDGKTLYVGSSEEVRSYQMEEINRHIENLPHKWQNIDIAELTGLIYRPGKGLYPRVKNYMCKEP